MSTTEKDVQEALEQLKKDEAKKLLAEKQDVQSQPDVKQDTPPKQLPQRFPFIQVPNELARTYVMENGERLSIPNVVAYSEMKDGGHRVISNNNGGQVAFTVPPKWIWIEHVAKQGIYVFS